MLTLLILGISISITNFYVFGELSSADKQDIKALLDDTVRQFLERLLDKDKKTSEFILNDESPSDYLITKDEVKELTYPDQLNPPDIDEVRIHSNENFINSTTHVWNYGNKLFDSSVNLKMVVSKAPFSNFQTLSFPLSRNDTGPGTHNSTVDIGVGNITTHSNSTTQHPYSYILDVNSSLRDFGITDADQYAVGFSGADEELINGSYWRAEDSVKGILIPPPQYTFSVPQSLDLKPGQETLVKIGLNSPVALVSQVMVSTPFNPILKADFITSKLIIPKQSTGYLTLWLKVPENASESNFVLPIIANVSFPNLESFTLPIIANVSYGHLIYQTEMQLKPMEFNSSLAISIVPNEPPSLSIPPEVLATIYTIVISAIIGWSIPNIASYISSRKRRRNFLKYITTIDEKYDTQKDNINALKDWLSTFERRMQYALGNGEISESQYDLLKKKIDYYSSDHVNPEER
jgi:hypothetical protein